MVQTVDDQGSQVVRHATIPLSAPDVTEQDVERVVEVLRSGRLSLGPALEAFEARFAETVGSAHAVAVSSGTAALHLAMLAVGVQAGDEVVTTPFSFVASANCILMAGGTPVFVDIDAATWNIDSEQVAAVVGERTAALLPVHVFGQPVEMDAIMNIGSARGLAVVEDSCEALGACYGGAAAGTIGSAGTFAFYPNKQITTGEGGMLVTDLDAVAASARSLRNQGRDRAEWLEHARLGYNYRLSDIAAALGLSQLERLDQLLDRRTRVAAWYRQRLDGDDRILFQRIPPQADMSWFVMVVRLADDYGPDARERILQHLRAAGIGCSNYFTPIHLQPFYRERCGHRDGEFPVCEHIAARTIALPFHSNLTEPQVERVCTVLKSAL